MEQLDQLESKASGWGGGGCLGKDRKLQICEILQEWVLEFPGEEERLSRVPARHLVSGPVRWIWSLGGPVV